MKKTKQLFAGLILLLSGLGTLQAGECPSNKMEGSVCLPQGFPVEAAPVDYKLNLMEGHTRLSHDVYDLHMLILWICVLVGIAVFGVMFYSIYHHRKSKGHVAAQFHHSTTVEIIWTIIPALILLAMAIPATKTMMEMDDVKESDMTIKVTGWQWKWEYDYLDSGIHFFSNLDAASNKARQLDADVDLTSVNHYLLSVDEPLVIPVKKKIRLVFTAKDVIHSWWVPDLGWKKDAIPGFINEAWTSVDDVGIYRGQCTELCGKDHAFMPVVVIAMEQADYDAWVKEKAKAPQDNTNDLTHEELVSKGAEVYSKNCAACHMENGAGVPPAFPALTGSKVVNGDINEQTKLILNGKNVMPAFGEQLKASELAQVITYTRNALGNSKGDEIQPKAIKAMQGGKAAKVGAPAEVAEKKEVAEKQEAVAAKDEQPKKQEKEVKIIEKPSTHKSVVGANNLEAAKKQDEEVENVQFAQDKFYPAKKFTDKPANESAKKPAEISKKADKATSASGELTELANHGASVYEKSCQSCHQKEGAGMPPMFPSLQGSKVVTGKIDAQIELMLKGKGMMPAFKSLSAKDFAGVLAYTRNKMGSNATGDFKKPSEIEALLK